MLQLQKRREEAAARLAALGTPAARARATGAGARGAKATPGSGPAGLGSLLGSGSKTVALTTEQEDYCKVRMRMRYAYISSCHVFEGEHEIMKGFFEARSELSGDVHSLFCASLAL